MALLEKSQANNIKVGVTGLLVPPADPSAMALSILSFIADRSSIGTMGARGYDRFHERFTAEQMSQRMHSVYKSVIESSRPKSRAG